MSDGEVVKPDRAFLNLDLDHIRSEVAAVRDHVYLSTDYPATKP
jgi:hypothetical protein